ncbi:MAG TPA: glycoside hydrolase family 95 protein, partial [Agriterribacter sp.]|nr:glycoside hydrolase family 95 protein [Agriterribacter sp.]
NYGMNGWCAHHNTDIWRSTGAGGNWGEGNPHWATWNMAGAWLSAHLFEHYRFTGDRQFLQEKAWPVMKGAAEFCLDWLITDKSGQLISVPSVSPENTFITNKGDTAQISVNTTSDIALIKQLFTNCIRASRILKSDQEFCEKLKKAIQELPDYSIGSKQQLLEWTSGEWNSVDPAHRHLSHMYPVYPGDEISPNTTPQLSEAAKKALSLRTKTNSSWGFAWKAACWARLGEGDSAWQTWQYQLQYMDPSPQTQSGKYGLFPNFFNSEGNAVILNGNGCATAVLTEMLLQSHTDTIQLLPALPKPFGKGTIKGICARNGFVVDLDWKDHQLTHATITSTLGNECRIRPGKKIKIYDQEKEQKITKVGNETYVFNTKKGHHYSIIAQ